MNLARIYEYKLDGIVVAKASLTLGYPLKDCAVIESIIVDRNYRRQGIASRLLQYIITEADMARITLFIDAWPLELDQISPEALGRFYRKLGFRDATIKKRLQRNPHNPQI